MKLGERLAAVASLVVGATAADIGTDHAKLAIELVRTGRVRRMIAADKNSGPCAAARRAVAAAGLTDKIAVRQGDGLAVLNPGEVETAIIAGMGGQLLLNILRARPQVLASLSHLILQPQTDIPAVRRQLAALGWRIDAETLVAESGHLYIALRAEPTGEPFILSDEAAILGSVLQTIDGDLVKQHLEKNIAKLSAALNGMAAGRGGSAPDRERYERELAVFSAAKERLNDG